LALLLLLLMLNSGRPALGAGQPPLRRQDG